MSQSQALPEAKGRLNLIVVLVSIVAALAGLLFGYDVGIISGALLFIKQTFHLSASLQGSVVAMVPLGALLASALCGRFNDLLGRKSILMITAVLFTAGSLVCSLSQSVEVLLVGRILLGFAVGLGSFSAPLYIAEIADKRFRGGLVTLNQLAIVCGIMLAYAVDYGLASSDSWRYMLGLGAMPAIVLFVAAIFLPESPRWLLMRGRIDEAKYILQKIFKDKNSDSEVIHVRNLLNQEQLSMREAFRSGFAKVLGLGVFVSILTQAVGINAIIYYAPTIFGHTGFDKASSAILATLGIGAVNVIFTLFAVFFLDKAGRRKMLMIGVSGIVLSLVALVIAFSIGFDAIWLAWVAFVSMGLFVASQAVGTGPACWLIPAEIFPLKVRGVGMGLSVAFNWGANVVVAFLFPIVLAHGGGVAAFAGFLLIAVIAWLYFYHFVPETKGVSLEKIEANLVSGKASRRLGE